MHESNWNYYHGTEELHGFLAYEQPVDKPRPAVMVVHDWSGRNAFACQKASELAKMGYVGFAVDMYGHGQLAVTTEEKMALMQPLLQNRTLLRDRMVAALETVKALPEVDSQRIAVIGFCFGGLCALDLARSGADLQGAVSFHGLLNAPENVKPQTIKAKILALHGYEDPMTKPDQVNSFCQEMTKANADWQVHMYGHVEHAFTNPEAHDTSLGLIYNPNAARRAWAAMHYFLQEIL